jgi:hypothetical protein
LVVVKNRAPPFETLEMGDISGRSEEPRRMFVSPL